MTTKKFDFSAGNHREAERTESISLNDQFLMKRGEKSMFLNLSETGARIKSLENLSVLSDLFFVVAIESYQMEIHGRIVNVLKVSKNTFEYGVKFIDLTENQKVLLRDLAEKYSRGKSVYYTCK